jgi:hypothetical protein
MLSLSGILEKIILRLFHPHSFQFCVNQVLRKQVVNSNTEILCGRYLVREARIEVQVGVVKAVNHLCAYARIEVGQVADHPGYGVHLATYGYFHDVIVAVAVGIGALAVNGVILLLAIRVCKEAMGGAQHVSAR